MKLTGNLKKQVEKAETKDEKKSLIENAGMLLNDDELEMVSGGSRSLLTGYPFEATWNSKCSSCVEGTHQWEIDRIFQKYVCPNCRSTCSDKKPSKEELQRGFILHG